VPTVNVQRTYFADELPAETAEIAVRFTFGFAALTAHAPTSSGPY
jgi:hypothetical protein